MVNSRCEIALSRVINVPDRGLDHQAFTDLRHAAKQTGLSLFQVNCELNFCELECSDSVYLSRTQRDVHIWVVEERFVQIFVSIVLASRLKAECPTRVTLPSSVVLVVVDRPRPTQKIKWSMDDHMVLTLTSAFLRFSGAAFFECWCWQFPSSHHAASSKISGHVRHSQEKNVPFYRQLSRMLCGFDWAAKVTHRIRTTRLLPMWRDWTSLQTWCTKCKVTLKKTQIQGTIKKQNCNISCFVESGVAVFSVKEKHVSLSGPLWRNSLAALKMWF